MKKIFKSLSLSIVIAFTMSITSFLSNFDNSNISVIEAASKQTFKTYTVNTVNSSSTKKTGKDSPSSSSGSSSSSKYVYANGGKYTSNIYHKTPKAHNMEGAIKMTVSQAKAKGYRACKRCW
nr:hypothetical protein [uncultured Terrisporobacter sp.]